MITRTYGSGMSNASFSILGRKYALASDNIPAMVGATDTNDGMAGLVPEPKKGDEKKFLCADGTWREAIGPSTTATSENYSTKEQVIGTWIDGKPLYQITLTGTTDIKNMGGAAINCTSLGIDQCVSIDGYIHNANGGFNPVGWRNETSSAYIFANLGADKAIYIVATGAHLDNRPYYITIKYTKA